MTITFTFPSISIQVTPEKDLCLILRNGYPIWAGKKDELIQILNELK